MESSLASPAYPPGYLGESIGSHVLGCAIAFIVLEISIVALRYSTRYVTHTRSGWDDWLVLPALISSVAVCALGIGKNFLFAVVGLSRWRTFPAKSPPAMVQHGGLGRHEIALLLESPSTVIIYAKLQFSFMIAYILAVTFPKVAILSLYLRFFNEKRYRIACYAVMIVTVTYSAMAVVITSLMCVPLTHLWDLAVKARCIDIQAWWRWSTLPSIIIDVIMLILPVPVVLKIKLPRRDKVGLLLTFSAGGM